MPFIKLPFNVYEIDPAFEKWWKESATNFCGKNGCPAGKECAKRKPCDEALERMQQGRPLGSSHRSLLRFLASKYDKGTK